MAFTTVVPEDPWTQANRLGQYRTGVLQQYPAGPVIQQHLAGQIPADVLSQLYQRGAESGISRGMPGSDATNAATMRALGLTSYGIQSQGLSELADLYKLPGAPPPGGTRLWTPGLQNTGAPMGGPAPGGGGGAGGAGAGPGGVKPSAPAGPPGGGYDPWLEDWMRRAGTGATGSLGVFAPAFESSEPDLSGGSPLFPGYVPTSRGTMYMGENLEGTAPGSLASQAGGGEPGLAEDWWKAYVPDYTEFGEPEQDPWGFSQYYYPPEE